MLIANGELIFEGTNSIVYYQEESEFQRPVIVKVLRNDHPSPEQIQAFFNEYEITRTLDIQGIRRALKKGKVEGRPAIVMEYVAGDALQNIFNGKKFSLAEFLQIGIKICQVLGEIHQGNVIHKDINGKNIILTSDQEVRIIDFGISSRINLKTQNLGNPEKLEGTLPYISPEQTGRMNRVVDYRTDLYSLGVVFYELLTEKLPFESKDALELVHFHLAQVPLAPQQVNAKIPEVISNIILKLLSKSADERYQTAFGLKADLEKCLQQLAETGRIENFKLGEEDFSGKLQIPQKLYGREAQIDFMLRAYDRACKGSTELLLVSGYSGVGKSALVHEIHRPVTEKRGFFVEGKFDQFQKNVPYLAWIQAFAGFINLLLTEDSEKLADWKKKILKAVGNNGKVLTDVIPGLSLVIGEQPPVDELGATEAENRFHYVIQNFVNAISRAEHPLVIFLDDWQWADAASLELLKTIHTNCNEDYLLIIGAYRNNEVNASHPFAMTLDELREEGYEPERIELTNLSHPHVEELLSDTLHLPKPDLGDFDELVYEKTQGNAFFVNQILKSLYEEGVLHFDFQVRRWTWDIEQIKALNITDNVVDLMTHKVQKLPISTQNTLKLASGIGSRFSLPILSIVEDNAFSGEFDSTQQRLEVAMMEGLVIPLDKEYKFAHDRIQQAIYSLIPEEDRKAIHLKIGKLLIDHIGEDKREQFIFDIVNQWNLGIDLLQNETERHFLAELNYIAGTKARDSAAYEPAFNYLQIAISLLSENSWESEYKFTLQVFCEALQAAFLKGDLMLTQQYTAIVLEKAKNTLDKMPAFEIEMQYHIAQNNQYKAIEAGLRVVDMLGVSLTDTPYPNLNAEKLLDLPLMTDDSKQAAMEIMDSVITPAWGTNPDLFKKITYTMVNLSVDYGNCASSCVGYVFYGSLLCGTLGDIETGYQFGKLGVKLLDRFHAKFFKSKVDNLFISNVMHWKEPARATRKPHFDAIQVGLETGEIEFASYNVVEACHYHFIMGIGLENLKLKFEKDRGLIEQLQQEYHVNYLAPWQQMLQNLMAENAETTRLIGHYFNEDEAMPEFEAENQLTLEFVVFQAKTVLAYLVGDYEAAYEFVEKAEKFKEGVSGMLHVTMHNFYYSLVLIAMFPKVAREQKSAILQQIDTNQRDLKLWAFHSPENNQHKYDLIQAELMRLSGQVLKAMDYYDKSIEGAKKSKFLPEEALANELAAKFYLDQDKEKIAKAYFQEAYHKYQLWGAKRKLENLEKKYDKFLKGITNPFYAPTGIKNTTVTTGTTGLFSLDVNTILKASQTLSGEVVLGNLLQKMMRIVIENAGAEKGLFLLPQENGWFIEAECNVHSQEVQALQSIPIEQVNGFSDNPKLSTEVVYYVVRTRENLVLHDATNERRVIGAAYVQKVQPKSVLCMPLLYQGKLSGILYLENNLTTDAFTPARLEILEMLSTQITISVQNALLYENLEEKVRERTAEVITQKEIIEKKNQDITSSINYAKRIQDATLPKLEYIKEILPESFIFFRPRDIVSGDFYWATKTDPIPIYKDKINDDGSMRKVLEGFENEKIIITAADCTGHGVPGAFMSMTGMHLLNEIVELRGITSPEQILYELHKGVRTALRQAETENRDGMDLALCTIDVEAKVVEYSGAKNQLVYIQNKEVFEIKADKLPIGGVQKESERIFTKHAINIGDEGGKFIPTYFYMFSDGFPDQFGEETGQKFMTKRLKNLLLEIHQKPMDEQRTILRNTFMQWMGKTKQLDDVIVMGFKIG
ncbi:MAG: trifunctional serine/threonine-protein kinase/ATP-binding protein/SpoIIE family protein phosphatase [Microscillaceae bacterium]|jgi:predicted ATPase/GAF domain-containing protein/predicted Ser/Thr protein kinase|nr:trifunctional serine/threonine-protein kinase/ATP-binding protein/SpoIIE family protein phosphatase [Microscillaceae bacterium]